MGYGYDVYDAYDISDDKMEVLIKKDVIEMMLAGASAIEVGAANLRNPYACKEIIEDLPKVMEKYGIDSLKDIIGAAH